MASLSQHVRRRASLNETNVRREIPAEKVILTERDLNKGVGDLNGEVPKSLADLSSRCTNIRAQLIVSENQCSEKVEHVFQ